MDNRKKKKNKHKNKNNSNTSTKTAVTPQDASQVKEKAEPISQVKENTQTKPDVKPAVLYAAEKKPVEIKRETQKEGAKEAKAEAGREVKEVKTEIKKKISFNLDSIKSIKRIGEMSPEELKLMAMKAAKLILPAVACIIIIAVAASYSNSRKNDADSAMKNVAADAEAAWFNDNPLKENAYSDVNELMNKFYKALSDGDMDTVKALKDYNSDKDIITYEKKSEIVESYGDIKCYTKSGIDEDTYFVYATYSMKVPDIETTVPGLEPWYVYRADDGSLKIDGDITEENVVAAFKLITNQDDVKDLYRVVNVGYEEALALDDTLKSFMEEIPVQINQSVGKALEELEARGNEETPQTEAQDGGQTKPSAEGEEIPQNQAVNQIVKVTDTVNVRSSDSEEADKLGKAQAGTEITRIEERANGWSKVMFDGREAYIKSDYLEVVKNVETEQASENAGQAQGNAGQASGNTAGKATALTNVNVRNAAGETADKIGTAQAGNAYDVLEDKGDWLKINYKGTTGFVKAEFFQR